MANSNFGKANPNAIRYAQDVRRGWGIRPYTWDVGTELQHQLSGTMSLTAGYYHNLDGAFTVTDNLNVAPADYDQFCVTAPLDSRLPKGGGYQICGLADIMPSKFGSVSNLVTQSSNFGRQKRVNDFFGVNLEARLTRGMRIGGGVDSGRTVDDVCFDVDSPSATAANLPGVSTTPVSHTATTIDGKKTCRVVTPLAGNTQLKLNGSFPFPGDVMVSATYQNLPGLTYIATYNATTAEIAPSLGRNLSGGTRTLAIPLVMPQTMREKRRSQIDLRLTKYLNFGQRRLQANFDLYNLLNSSDVLGENTTFGANWQRPTLILNGRLIQFSANMNF
jgi:hypothetical protein